MQVSGFYHYPSGRRGLIVRIPENVNPKHVKVTVTGTERVVNVKHIEENSIAPVFPGLKNYYLGMDRLDYSQLVSFKAPIDVVVTDSEGTEYKTNYVLVK